MAQITIDGKEYDSDDLSEEAKKMFNNLRFVQNEIARLQALIGVHQTSASVYSSKLSQELESSE